jgi:taurine--2-oxoglutarate transaminase
MGYDVSTQVCLTDEPAGEIVRLTKKHDVNSKRLGAVLLSRLEEIKKGHPSVGDVRGMGLFAAIELVKDGRTREPVIPWTVEFYEKKHPLTSQLLARLKEHGLYTYMRWECIDDLPTPVHH